MQQSVPSANLHKTGRSGWYTRGLCCYSEGPWQAEEMGLQSWAREITKPCTWGGTIPCTRMCWGLPGWIAAVQKRTWGSWWTPHWTWASNVPLQKRKLMVSWAAWEVLPAGEGRWSFSSVQHWWGQTWSAGSSSGHTSTRETWTHWKESSKGPLRLLRD